LIAASPCVRVALPKRASSKVVPLGVVDVEGLAAAVPTLVTAICANEAKD